MSDSRSVDAAPAGPSIARRYAWAYLIVGAPLLVAMIFLLRPFGAPDELWHFRKAASVADGHVVPIFLRRQDAYGPGKTAGAPLDDGLASVTSDGERLAGDGPARRSAVLALRHVTAGNGVHFHDFANTAIYLPFFYVPAAIGIAAVRSLDAHPFDWLYAGRIADALLWLLAAWYAIRLAGRRAPLLFCLAVLPITLQQAASLSADSGLFAAMIVFGALIERLARLNPLPRFQLILLAALTVVIGSGKIGFLPFAVLPAIVALARQQRADRQTMVLAGAAVVAIAIWLMWAGVIHDSVLFYRDGKPIDPHQQIAWMAGHPLAASRTLLWSGGRDALAMLLQSAGNKLGWLSVIMPRSVSIAVLCCIGLTAIFADPGERRSLWPFAAAVLLGLVTYGLIYVLLYLQYNPVGAARVQGFQGRYVTPMLMVALPLAPQWRRPSRIPRWLAVPCAGVWCSALYGLVLLTRDGWA